MHSLRISQNSRNRGGAILLAITFMIGTVFSTSAFALNLNVVSSAASQAARRTAQEAARNHRLKCEALKFSLKEELDNALDSARSSSGELALTSMHWMNYNGTVRIQRGMDGSDMIELNPDAATQAKLQKVRESLQNSWGQSIASLNVGSKIGDLPDNQLVDLVITMNLGEECLSAPQIASMPDANILPSHASKQAARKLQAEAQEDIQSLTGFGAVIKNVSAANRALVPPNRIDRASVYLGNPGAKGPALPNLGGPPADGASQGNSPRDLPADGSTNIN